MKAFSLPFDNFRIGTTKNHYVPTNLFIKSNVLQPLCQTIFCQHWILYIIKKSICCVKWVEGGGWRVELCDLLCNYDGWRLTADFHFMRSKLAREGRRNYISDSKYHYNSTDYRLETQTERGGLATASVRSDK